MTPRPTDPDRPDEARAYLQGFDDHADVIDLGPIERNPQDVVIYDRGARRLATFVATSGDIVIRAELRGSQRVVTALNAENARRLSDALQWAARLADPR
jgi:hypothetical protein